MNWAWVNNFVWIGFLAMLYQVIVVTWNGEATLEDLKNKILPLGTFLCPYYADACKVDSEVCSRRSRRCEYPFNEGVNEHQKCCTVLLENDTRIEGLFGMCLCLYGSKFWREHCEDIIGTATMKPQTKELRFENLSIALKWFNDLAKDSRPNLTESQEPSKPDNSNISGTATMKPPTEELNFENFSVAFKWCNDLAKDSRPNLTESQEPSKPDNSNISGTATMKPQTEELNFENFSVAFKWCNDLAKDSRPNLTESQEPSKPDNSTVWIIILGTAFAASFVVNILCVFFNWQRLKTLYRSAKSTRTEISDNNLHIVPRNSDTPTRNAVAYHAVSIRDHEADIPVHEERSMASTILNDTIQTDTGTALPPMPLDNVATENHEADIPVHEERSMASTILNDNIQTDTGTALPLDNVATENHEADIPVHEERSMASTILNDNIQTDTGTALPPMPLDNVATENHEADIPVHEERSMASTILNDTIQTDTGTALPPMPLDNVATESDSAVVDIAPPTQDEASENSNDLTENNRLLE